MCIIKVSCCLVFFLPKMVRFPFTRQWDFRAAIRLIVHLFSITLNLFTKAPTSDHFSNGQISVNKYKTTA